MLPPHRILIADGQAAPLLAQVFTHDFPHTIMVTTDDGCKALALIQDTDPDVIILDIALASMDGLTLVSHLSPVQRGKVLLHSAHHNQRTIPQAKALGIPYFLPKPATKAALLQAIHAIVTQNTGISLPNPT